jgi:hypothetical protein
MAHALEWQVGPQGFQVIGIIDHQEPAMMVWGL